MRVLVIEDDDGILGMVEDILSDQGHSVLKTRGEHPIPPLVREYAPDVIILDLALPTTSGEIILKLLWEEEDLRSIPILISSVWRTWSRAVYQEARQRGQRVMLLPKPYGFYELVGAVERAVE